jgi:predicted nuclease of predicted toxin-antitoxin system
LVKLILDENVPRDVKEWLSKKGFEVILVSQTHLKGAKDYAIADYAAKSKAAIITLDQDFARIYRTFPKGTLAVVIIKAIPSTPSNIIEVLSSAQGRLNLKELENKLVVMTKKKLRIVT